MTKNQQLLLEYLGPEYSIQIIDTEECLHRRINDTYDIEISGTSRASRSISVYVWHTKGGLYTVEIIHGIKSKETLKETLDHLISKYEELDE